MESTDWLLDIKVHYLLGIIGALLLMSPFFWVYLGSLIVPKWLNAVCLLSLLLIGALLGLLIGVASASYVRRRADDVVEIRSQNLLLVFVVLIICAITIFLYYVSLSNILAKGSGWETLAFPLVITPFLVFLVPAAFSITITVDDERLRCKSFRANKVIRLSGIVYVSPGLQDSDLRRPLVIYSKDGIVYLNNIFHSPAARKVLKSVLADKIGSGIFSKEFDLRNLDADTRKLIEKEKVMTGYKGMAATAWSNEAAVLSIGVFLMIFVWICGSGAVVQFLRGKTTEFLVLLAFTVGFGLFFAWILASMIVLRRYEFKIFKSSRGEDPKWIMQEILNAQKLKYAELPGNRMPCPFRFDFIWRIDEGWFIRIKVMKRVGQTDYWISIGPKNGAKEEHIRMTKRIIDAVFKSIA